MDEAAGWTIDELVLRAAHALAGSAQAGTYAGAPNGRVRELPDQRAVRWYSSIGLVDRPLGGRGRGARYGVRHLRQLVAVKHLQARGLVLAEIQGRLAGIADDELARLAPLPSGALAAESEGPGTAGRTDLAHDISRRFWALHPPSHGSAPAASPPGGAGPASLGEVPSAVEALTGLRLAPGVLLVLPQAPAAADLAALAEAARPLLAALSDRGLIPSPALHAEPTEGASR